MFMTLSDRARRRTGLAVVSALILFAAACGGDDESGSDGLIDAAGAAAYVAAVVPDLGDLPGAGWTEVSLDEGGDDAAEPDDEDEFDRALRTEPACAEFVEIDDLSSLFGDADIDPLAEISAEYERVDDDELLPLSLSVDVEVQESESVTGQQFDVIKDLVESGSFSACFEAAFATAFAELDPSLETSFTARDTIATAPQGGTGFAFDFTLSAAGLSVDTVMELQFWPYSNSGISVLSFFPAGQATPENMQGILDLIDANAQAAAAG